MPYLQIEDGSQSRVFKLGDAPVIIGSDNTSNLRLSGDKVSPKHCQIVPIAGTFKLIDLDTKGGTYVNGIKIHFGTLSLARRSNTHRPKPNYIQGCQSYSDTQNPNCQNHTLGRQDRTDC